MKVLYDRNSAVTYAKEYATKRNNKYYNFDKIGGNCTNFCSQCLYSGLPIMNYDENGWYYSSINKRSPSWTDVRLFYDFLIKNDGVGPYAIPCPLQEVEVGDFIQLKNQIKWHHSLVVCSVLPNDILVCANSFDAYMRSLFSYTFMDFRCIKILGGRKF